MFVVLQLRPKSKAAMAGMMQGDIVVAVNGYNCDEVSHDRLTSLVEHAGHYLDIDVWRPRSVLLLEYCSLDCGVHRMMHRISLHARQHSFHVSSF